MAEGQCAKTATRWLSWPLGTQYHIRGHRVGCCCWQTGPSAIELLKRIYTSISITSKTTFDKDNLIITLYWFLDIFILAGHTFSWESWRFPNYSLFSLLRIFLWNCSFKISLCLIENIILVTPPFLKNQWIPFPTFWLLPPISLAPVPSLRFFNADKGEDLSSYCV